MKKRALFLALALVMALGVMPVAALAAEPEIKWQPEGMEYVRYLEDMKKYLARDGDEWFLLDSAGNIAVRLGELGYDSIEWFYNGLAVVKKDGKCGAVDEDFNLVIPLEFDALGEFYAEEGELATFKGSNGKWGAVDRTGKVLVPPSYDEMIHFFDGVAHFRENGEGLYGLVDLEGNVLVPPQYATVFYISDGLWMAIEENEKYEKTYSLIDNTGKVVVPLEYKEISSFSEGLAVVWKDGLSGYIDTSGELVIPAQYKYARDFSDGVACVIMPDPEDPWNEKVSYIDKKGDILFTLPGHHYPAPYGGTSVYSFSDGLVQFRPDSRSPENACFMDKEGNVVFMLPEGASCSDIGFRNGLLEVATPDGWGLLDKTGAYVLSPSKQYKYVTAADVDTLMIRREDDRWAVLRYPIVLPVQADPTNDKLTVNGEVQNATVYKIGDSNYFKIRDLAAILNGTSKQFSVGYDGEKQSVIATPGQPYEPAGTELAGTAPSSQTAEASNDAIYVKGEKVEAQVYKIDGSNYFKLRDLGSALGFDVGRTKEAGMFIDTEA